MADRWVHHEYASASRSSARGFAGAMRTGDVEVGTYGPCDEGSAIDCGRRKRNSRARSVRAGFGLPGADTTYATSEGTADLNTDLRALEIADVETNASEAAGAWDEEIKIGRRDRIVISPARDVTRHAVTLIVGASLSALAFCVVWLGGSDSPFYRRTALRPEKTVKSSADRPDTAKPGQPSASSADAIAAPIGSVHGTSKRGVQHIEPSGCKGPAAQCGGAN